MQRTSPEIVVHLTGISINVDQKSKFDSNLIVNYTDLKGQVS